ncbi:hypothetical protein PHLGIDRAFT_296322 [Phlebiopsis gigantea 11061_1 CR5-6]|uniref:F-box domain-containing protein n=1 Tax=Phlebiopsis gigantea (strain 11061_1 CR5-6) TaxID=745531 RepID=A0A0C3NWU4_PHLG1|nr:hypothetical protein PHLGIDRAFT_296322 [Phlebiopsis gigantea 11061_1 CR5-6]
MFIDEPSLFRRDPTYDEVVAANAEIARQENTIAVLDNKIQSYMSEIGRLRATQRTHHEVIRRCKGVITLARRIPQELLAKIFEHCVADGWTRAPIVVSHVCSAWRKAATTPRVWSHIYLDADSTNALERLRFWLQRASHAPLLVDIVGLGHTLPTQLVNSISLLSHHATQVESLRIALDGLVNVSFAISQFMHPMANLRELSVRTTLHQEGDREDGFTLSEVFSQQLAPNLSEVRFSCNVLPHSLRLPPHITTLSITVQESPTNHPLSNLALVELLEGVPEIERLIIQLPLVYEAQLVNEDSERTVDLSCLTSLAIYGPTDLNDLLMHIRARNLRELHLRSLEDVSYRQEHIGPSLLRFLTKSQPSLEVLELHDVDLSPRAFALCFSALPNLRTLRLHESSISDATLKLLAGRDAMCPKLTRLDLRWCSHLTGGALVDLVRYRTAVGDSNDMFVKGDVTVEPISEIGILNCCFVEEREVLQLAKMTTVRLLVREDDFCRSRQCCENTRYRLRLRLRHFSTLSLEERKQYHLIV